MLTGYCLKKCLFNCFAYLKVRLFIFILFSSKSSLYTSYSRLLSGICFENNIFSTSKSYLFTFWSSLQHKIDTLMEFNVSIVSFAACASGFISEKILPNSWSWICQFCWFLQVINFCLYFFYFSVLYFIIFPFCFFRYSLFFFFKCLKVKGLFLILYFSSF